MASPPLAALRKKTRPFTQIPNELINDKRISFRAKGIYALIESKPDGWVFRETNLIAASSEGRDAFRVAARELISAGWLKRFQERGSSGHFVTVYEILTSPLTENPSTDFPSTVSPSTESQATYKDGDSNTDLETKNIEKEAAVAASKKKAGTDANRGQRLEAYLEDNAAREPYAWFCGWTIEAFGWDTGRAARTFETFCDYWRAQPGAKGVKADWPATWRNWCRRENERSTGGHPGGPYRTAGQRNATAALLESAQWDSVAARMSAQPGHGPKPDTGGRTSSCGGSDVR